jgi:pre-mRNA-processing factor 40
MSHASCEGSNFIFQTESKESKWDMPDELLLILEKVEKESKAAPPPATGYVTILQMILDIFNMNTSPAAITAPGFTPVGSTQGALVPMGGGIQSLSASQSNGVNGAENSLIPHTGVQPATSAPPIRPSLPDDPVIPHNGFPTTEEAEKAFMHLLRKAGVDATWTWDQTMRAIITDPLYKALNSLAERKATWEKVTTLLFSFRNPSLLVCSTLPRSRQKSRRRRKLA